MFHDFKYVFFGALLFLLIGAAAGWLAGSLAGDYMGGFRFAGTQGNEAAENFGVVLGGILGALTGANFGKLRAKRHRK